MSDENNIGLQGIISNSFHNLTIEEVEEKIHELKTVRLELLQKEVYKKRPDLWFVERLGMPETFLEWSKWDEEIYKDHKWDGDKDPFYKAAMALAEGKNVFIESGTGSGKTFTICFFVFWFLDVFDDSLIITTAPTGEQLRRGLWGEIEMNFDKFLNIRPQAEKTASLQLFPQGSPIKDAEKMSEDDQKKAYICKGITTSVSGADQSAIKFQGSHRKYMLHLIDECAGIPLSVLTAIENTSTGDFNPYIGVGNPDNQTDPLHKYALKKTSVHIRISSYDHPNVVLGRTVIHGAVTSRSIEERRLEYGEESNLFLSRVRGLSPEQSSTSVIKKKWIERCSLVSQFYDEGQLNFDKSSKNAIGLDVANSESGDDASVAYGQKYILKELRTFKCPNANHLAYNLMWDVGKLMQEQKEVYNIPTAKQFNVKAERIAVDGVGVGVGTVNEFKDPKNNWNVKVIQGGQEDRAIPFDENDKPLYKFVSMRAQMIFMLGQELQKGEICIAIMDQEVLRRITEQATMHEYELDAGKIKITSKKDIKKRLGYSPNEFDALVYWNWMRKERNIEEFVHDFVFAAGGDY